MSNINNINNINIINKTFEANIKKASNSGDFSTLLKKELDKNTPLQFSRHAQERVEQRGIELTPELINQLNNAVSKARDKGVKDVVIIDRTSNAFIVNVTNNTVITTLASDESKGNIFTNIDSAVIL